jgi:predicted dienelactone hydrolase
MVRHLLLSALLVATPSIANAEGFHVGQGDRQFHPTAPRNWRGAKTQVLATKIWYPVDPALPEQAHDIGPPGATFFYGHKLVPGAGVSPARKTNPLILLSHGTGGNADSLDWLGAGLAEAGYIVAAVDHPGNNAGGPMTWDGMILWWERATDVSNVLDGLLADPILGPRIDRDRIGAAGFSLGGYTVLALAGARTNLAGFMAFCKSPAADMVCHPPEMDRVSDQAARTAEPSPATKESQARAGDSYRDKRIKAVFAIAPAVAQAFDAKSFAEVTIPIALLAGDADTNVPPNTNARHVARLMPKAALTMVPGAAHYTFLPVCGPAMVARFPALCSDNPGVNRTAIHDQAVAKVRAFFAVELAEQSLKQRPAR